MAEFVGDYRWFENLSARHWKDYISPLFMDRADAVRYLEVGVAEGASLCWALENWGRPGGLFVGIDPFLNSRHWHKGEGNRHLERTLANVSAWYGQPIPMNPASDWQWDAEGRPGCEVHRESSQAYLKTESRAFDAIYIDGQHDADNALLDILLGFRLLRDGGVLIVDDVDRKIRGGRPQVWQAVEAFKWTHEGYFDPLYAHQKQVAFVKRPRRRRGYPPTMIQGPVIEPTGESPDA